MEKGSNSTNIVEGSATAKSDGKITKNKIRIKLKLRDFVKSPETQKYNRINTISVKKISKSSSIRKRSKYNSKENFQNTQVRKTSKKRKKDRDSIKLDVQEEQADTTPKKHKYNTDEAVVRTSPRVLHSSQSSPSDVRKQLFTEFEGSSDGTNKSGIEKGHLNVTPTKQEHNNEVTLRRTPRDLNSPKSSPSAVSKELFNTYNVLPEASESFTKTEQKNAQINVTPTKQKVKDEAVVLRRSPRSKQKEFNKKKREDSTRSSSTGAPKMRKKKYLVSSNSNLDVWLTAHKKKKDKSDSNELSSRDVTKIPKSKVSKNKSQENLTVQKSHEDKIKKIKSEKLKGKRKDDKEATKQEEKNNICNTSQEEETSDKLETLGSKTNRKEKDKLSSKRKLYRKSQDNIELYSKKSKLESSEMKIKYKDNGDNEQNNNSVKKYEKSSNRKLKEYSKIKIEQMENKEKKIVTKKSSSRKFKESSKVHGTKSKIKEKENSYSSKRTKEKTSEKTDKTLNVDKKQEKLDKYFEKKSKEKPKKTKFTRNKSSESSENTNKKSKTSKSTESFKKYGVTLPSIAEILKEQNDLENYKNQVLAFQEIEFEYFDFSVSDFNKTETNPLPILGCKHLTLDEITELFQKNLTYVSDIFFAKTHNERHNKFVSVKSRHNLLMIKDLTRSTSMIVFSFEQKQHLIKLLKEQFDSHDEWTSYFFQVLLPELCLKIFMDVHGMTRQAAVEYLDIRPIDD